jgi:hypothetical protein
MVERHFAKQCAGHKRIFGCKDLMVARKAAADIVSGSKTAKCNNSGHIEAICSKANAKW